MSRYVRWFVVLSLFAAVYCVSDRFTTRVYAQTVTINGRVSVPPAGTGTGIAGVSMLLTLNGSTQSTTQTDAGGNFSFSNIPSGSDYEVTPSKPNFIFTPTSQSGTNLTANRSLFFTGESTAAGTIQFSASTNVVGESTPDFLVTISRNGDTSTSASADYATSDSAGTSGCGSVSGNASSRCDYLTTLGTVVFAAGETSKVIAIPVIDDVYAEGSESFTISLTNASGASLGSPATATLTITDNDGVNGSNNPIDDASFFVRQNYVDFLNREPDSAGLNFWTNEINSCGSDTQCRDLKRINVSAAFFLSIEFQETGYLVYRMYKSGFGTLAGTPIPVRLNQFLRDTQTIGQGVRVGIGDWQAQLEANKQAYAVAFVQRPEFIAAFPNSMTADQFVTKVDTNAGGVLSTAEKANLISVLGATASDVSKRASVLRSVAEDSDLRNAEFNKAFVLMQYFGYMRRNPDEAPDADFGGFNFWLGKLNSFGGDFIGAEMVKAFVVSGEYRHRFGLN